MIKNSKFQKYLPFLPLLVYLLIYEPSFVLLDSLDEVKELVEGAHQDIDPKTMGWNSSKTVGVLLGSVLGLGLGLSILLILMKISVIPDITK